MKCLGRSRGQSGRKTGVLGWEQRGFAAGEDLASYRVWLLNDSTKLSQLIIKMYV